MKQKYKEWRPSGKTTALLNLMNDIVENYKRQGFVLTVRQLYYQLVAQAAIANTTKQYNCIKDICKKARLAGLIDWDMIEDRTRQFIDRPHWRDAGELLDACAEQYHEDLWQEQDNRVFCIIEKEALSGVLMPLCRELDVPLLAARGYPSVSVLREFAVNMVIPAIKDDQNAVILHLGDHDPSGVDMTDDLRERISLFTGRHVYVKRLALNLDQVEELNLPTNPAKQTDRRFKKYAEQYGANSWELDALPPEYLIDLVRDHTEEFIDPDILEATQSRIKATVVDLSRIAREFDEARI